MIIITSIVLLCRYIRTVLPVQLHVENGFANRQILYSQAFYCAAEPALENTEGCLLSCGADEVAAVDVAAKTWECQPRAAGFTCPGNFHIDCEAQTSFNIQCGCEGEVWVNGDCTQAFM